MSTASERQSLSPPNLSNMPRRTSNRSNVYRVTDRSPAATILPILQQHRGKSILIQVYRKGRARHFGYITEGEHSGERYSLRQQYDVPETHAGVNNFFRGKHHEGAFWDWRSGSDAPESLHLQLGDEIRVFEASHLPRRRRSQRFLAGITHCVFTPMLEWGERMVADAKNKQDRWTSNSFVRTVKEMIERYAEGVPEEEFQSIVDELGRFYKIHLTIELPFFNSHFSGNRAVLIDVTANTKRNRKKAFHFVNPRLDYVDLNEVVNKEQVVLVDTDALCEIMIDLDTKEQFYLFKKAKRGGPITSISTLQGTYTLQSEYTLAVEKFESETRLDDLSWTPSATRCSPTLCCAGCIGTSPACA
jgi:hypothetical protein